MDPTCAYSEKISLVSYKLETICLLCFSTLPSTCVYHETAGMLAEASNKVKKKNKKKDCKKRPSQICQGL